LKALVISFVFMCHLIRKINVAVKSYFSRIILPIEDLAEVVGNHFLFIS